MIRTFDRRHDGVDDSSDAETDNSDYSNHYPDGTPIEKLVPLFDREPPPAAMKDDPGYPGFMVDPDPTANRCTRERAGIAGEKSPIPPWPYPSDEAQAV